MGSGSAHDNATVEAALREWRRKAVNVFLAVSTIGLLPGVLIQLLIRERPITLPIIEFSCLSYALLVLCALFHRGDHRTRMWIVLVAGQVLALAAGATARAGPFYRTLPIPLSLMALVLLGRRSGLIVTASSCIVMLVSPFMVLVPGVPQLLQTSPEMGRPAVVLLSEGIALTASLACLMILLGRFHGFLIHSVASESRAVADLKREAEHRKALERELARVSEDERRRLGQEVHDGVCQELTGALLRCQALERRIERGEILSQEDLSALSHLLEEGMDEAHAVAKGLCPLEPVPDALTPALRSLVKRTQATSGVLCDFAADGDTSTDPTVAQHLYRIAQEALSNAARHSGASRISVRLSGVDDELRLLVEDNGSGLLDDLPTDRMGLKSMGYRAQIIEGELDVESLPDGGTCISCRVPRPANRSGESRHE